MGNIKLSKDNSISLPVTEKYADKEMVNKNIEDTKNENNKLRKRIICLEKKTTNTNKTIITMKKHIDDTLDLVNTYSSYSTHIKNDLQEQLNKLIFDVGTRLDHIDHTICMLKLLGLILTAGFIINIAIIYMILI